MCSVPVGILPPALLEDGCVPVGVLPGHVREEVVAGGQAASALLALVQDARRPTGPLIRIQHWQQRVPRDQLIIRMDKSEKQNGISLQLIIRMDKSEKQNGISLQLII